MERDQRAGRRWVSGETLEEKYYVVIPAKAGIQGPSAAQPDINPKLRIAYMPLLVGMGIFNRSSQVARFAAFLDSRFRGNDGDLYFLPQPFFCMNFAVAFCTMRK